MDVDGDVTDDDDGGKRNDDVIDHTRDWSRDAERRLRRRRSCHGIHLLRSVRTDAFITRSVIISVTYLLLAIRRINVMVRPSDSVLPLLGNFSRDLENLRMDL